MTAAGVCVLALVGILLARELCARAGRETDEIARLLAIVRHLSREIECRRAGVREALRTADASLCAPRDMAALLSEASAVLSDALAPLQDMGKGSAAEQLRILAGVERTLEGLYEAAKKRKREKEGGALAATVGLVGMCALLLL